MSFDPKGTSPGLAPTGPKLKTVNLKCPKCDSIEALEMPIEVAPHIGQRLYTCAKCGHPQALRVGGPLEI